MAFTSAVRVLLILPLCILAQTEAAAQSAPASVKLDRHGDPLPAGAIARLGTERLSHDHIVNMVRFTPDGRTLISSSFDHTCRFWDLATGKELRRYKSPHGETALTKDGKRLALPGSDASIQLLDFETGKLLKKLWGHHLGVHLLAFSPDGKMLASIGDSNRLGLWEVATGKALREFEHGSKIQCITFSPDGTSLVSTGQDGLIRFWNLETGEEVRRLAHGGEIEHVAFSPDGSLIGCGSRAKGFQLWNVKSGEPVPRQERKPTWSSYFAFSPDGATLALAQWDVIDLCDTKTGKTLAKCRGHEGGVRGLSFSPDGKILASGSNDHSIRLWDVPTGKEKFPDYIHLDTRSNLRFLTEGRTLVSWPEYATDPVIRFWDSARAEQLFQFKARSPGVIGHFLSWDGKLLAQLTDSNHLRIMEVPSGQLLHWRKDLPAPFARAGTMAAFAFSPDSKTYAFATREERINSDLRGRFSVQLCGARSGNVLLRLPPKPGDMISLDFSADGRELSAIVHWENRVDNWDAKTGRFINEGFHIGRDPGGKLQAVAIPVERKAGDLKGSYTDSSTEVIIVEANPSRHHIRTLFERILHVLPAKWYSCRISPCNRMVAIREPEFIQLRSLLTAKEIARWNVVGTCALGYSGDGRLLVSGHSNGTALVWDLTPYHAKARLGVGRVDDKRLQQLWTDLADANSAKAWQAIWTLAETPEQSVPFLKERLKPIHVPEGASTWIRDLGADEFAVRQNAMGQLRKHNVAVAHLVHSALKKEPTLEVERRLKQLLDEFDKPHPFSADDLRIWRCLEVLEQANTPEARELVQTLAAGAPEAWLTVEAAGVVRRLALRRP